MEKIALEDLITVVCECFSENIDEIQNYHNSTRKQALLLDSVQWYNERNDQEKRKISEQLLDIIENVKKVSKSIKKQKRSKLNVV